MRRTNLLALQNGLKLKNLLEAQSALDPILNGPKSPIVYAIIQDSVILKYGRSKSGKIPAEYLKLASAVDTFHVFSFRDEELMNNFYRTVKARFESQQSFLKTIANAV